MFENTGFVIIGGTSGMGLSTAQALQSYGARVVVVGLDDDSCNFAVQQLGENGIVIKGDATEEQTAMSAVRKCWEAFGAFNGLFHVAGGSGRKWGDGPLHDMTLSGWEKTLQLNLTSVMLSNRAALQFFLENNLSGSLLNMSSVLGYSPSPQYFHTHAYASAKAGIIGLSKSLAAYYAPKNIRVNVLAPALVETPMSQRAINNYFIMDFIRTKQPLDGGRAGVPEDLNELACFLLSSKARFITGQVIAVDGGWSVTEGQY